MPIPRFASPRRWPGALWWLLDTARRVVVDLLFLLIIALLIAWALRSGPPPLAEKTALVLDLHGSLVEQKTGNLRRSVLDQVGGQGIVQVQLRDVLAVLQAASSDPKISSLVLALDDLQGAGLVQLREVAAAIERFRTSGKRVIAWGSGYDQRQYYLAAHADEVYLHPLGMVQLDGLGGYRNYYRDVLDRLGVQVHLMRVGTFKSAAEPYIDNGPSPAAQEADAFLYNALWADYTGAVERARKLEPGSIMRLIDELPQRLAAAHGDAAQLALDVKLVDGLKTRDELRGLLLERGAADERATSDKDDTIDKTVRQVSFDDYLGRVPARGSGDAVGVVVAEGAIVDGNAAPGTIGGLSTSELIRKARQNPQIKAIVLRVDSPGGSVFGSELVRRELELTRAAGKPVVVSMGDLAASGGYWITTSSDEVIADADTITGSIGVFGLLPSVAEGLDKIGVHTGGTTTTWLRGAGDIRRPLDPRFAEVVQTRIDRIYADFLGRVAKARKTTPQKIDAVAQGRVWTGRQALERGLVDRLGSFEDALQSAAKRARLEPGFRVDYIERQPSKLSRLLAFFGGDDISAWLGTQLDEQIDGQIDHKLAALGVPPSLVRGVGDDLGWLSRLADARQPLQAIAHCLCRAP